MKRMMASLGITVPRSPGFSWYRAPLASKARTLRSPIFIAAAASETL